MAGFIDTAVVFVVIGGTVWALILLLFLGLARSASLADDEMEAYVAEELSRLNGGPEPQADVYDLRSREWIAYERKAAS